MPFAIPHDKPSRREALAYYCSVVRRYDLPLALHEEVETVTPEEDGFVVPSTGREGRRERRARAVALATGYFHNQRRLGVPGKGRGGYTTAIGSRCLTTPRAWRWSGAATRRAKPRSSSGGRERRFT